MNNVVLNKSVNFTGDNPHALSFSARYTELKCLHEGKNSPPPPPGPRSADRDPGGGLARVPGLVHPFSARFQLASI